jgi:hypothetical protein
MHEALIAEALRERLAEVRARVGPSAEAPPTAAPAAEDPEEALRVVMVRLWPAARERPEELVATLVTLAEAARGEDLRYLDAWNNAYERLGDAVPQPLLAAYAELLDHHVHRLAR